MKKQILLTLLLVVFEGIIVIVVARNVASLKSLSLKVNVKYSRKPW